MTTIDRRTLIKAGAGAAGLAAVGTKVIPQARPVSAQDGSAPFVFLATDTAYSLDPAQNWDYGGGATILAHTYEGLFKFVGTDQAVLTPNLAAEVPTIENGGISADGLTYTVKLKPGALFHDGSPVDAAAVKFSYDRLKTLKLGVDFLVEQVETIDAADESTVVFHLKRPFSPILYSLGSLWGNSIVSPTTINANSEGEADFGQAYLQFHEAGSGPYKLESYDPDQKQATLIRDPNWWQGWSEGPHIETVVIQWIAEAATIRSMLERGDAQIVAGLTPEDWSALSSNPDIATSEYAASLQSFILLNNKQAPFDDVRVRQALAYAFNYDQAINGILGGHGVKLDSVAAKPYNGYAPAATQYTFDLEKAKALLAEAGHGEGLDIELYALHLFQNDQLLLEMFQADLATIGVNLEVKTMDANAFIGQQTAGDPQQAYPGFISNVGGDYPDAYELLALVYAKRSQPPAFCCNLEFYENPQMEEIISRVEAALDPAERQAALQEGFDLAFAEAGVVWVHNFKQLVGMRANIQGYEYNFMYGANYAPFAQMSLA
jgi:peptide/nickel transport system substrate-binding protein